MGVKGAGAGTGGAGDMWAAGDRTGSSSSSASTQQAAAGPGSHRLSHLVVSSGITGPGATGAGPVAESSGFWVRSSTGTPSPRGTHSGVGAAAAAAAGASGSGGSSSSSSPRVAGWMPDVGPPPRWTYTNVPAEDISTHGAALGVGLCGLPGGSAGGGGWGEGGELLFPAPPRVHTPALSPPSSPRPHRQTYSGVGCAVPYTPAAVPGGASKPRRTLTGLGELEAARNRTAPFLPPPPPSR